MLQAIQPSKYQAKGCKQKNFHQAFSNKQSKQYVSNPNIDSSIDPYKFQILVNSPQIKASRGQRQCSMLSEENAKTILLSQSQKEVQIFQRHSVKPHQLLNPQKCARVAKHQYEQISPFSDNQEVCLKQTIISSNQKELPNHYDFTTRRCKSIQTQNDKKYSPENVKSIKISHIPFNEPSRECLFPEDSSFYGTRVWGHAYASENKCKVSRNNIKKSISLSLCQIVQKEISQNNPLALGIKQLMPLGQPRSHSVPLKIENKINCFTKKASKDIRGRNKKEKETNRKLDSYMTIEPHLNKMRYNSLRNYDNHIEEEGHSSKFNLSSIFRKLDAFKKKFTIFKTAPDEDTIQLRFLQISTQKPRSPQISNKLAQIRYKLMKTGSKMKKPLYNSHK